MHLKIVKVTGCVYIAHDVLNPREDKAVFIFGPDVVLASHPLGPAFQGLSNVDHSLEQESWKGNSQTQNRTRKTTSSSTSQVNAWPARQLKVRATKPGLGSLWFSVNFIWILYKFSGRLQPPGTGWCTVTKSSAIERGRKAFEFFSCTPLKSTGLHLGVRISPRQHKRENNLWTPIGLRVSRRLVQVPAVV